MAMSLVNTFNYLSVERDTDFVDRMHSFFTTNLLITFAVLVSFKQFGGRPIECMTPDTFTDAMEQYTESYCWSKDTYFLPFNTEIPLTSRKRAEMEISYYQWVPFFLLLQALCFRVPTLLWKYTASQSGIRVHDLVTLAVDEKNVDPAVREKNLSMVATHIQNALRFHRRLIKRKAVPYNKVICFCLNLPYSAFYVTSMYLLAKALYLGNVVLQLFVMNQFLMTDSGFLGFESISHILNGSSWEISGIFPRVAMCDVEARVLGGTQLFTIQCVLVINLFNEKIFFLLWFWFVIMMTATTISFLYWLFVTIAPKSGTRFVSRHLELADMPFDPENDEAMVERFVSSYLKVDGIFLLRMITMHTNIIFGTDLTKKLWDRFYGIEEEVQRTAQLVNATAPVFPQHQHKHFTFKDNIRFRGFLSNGGRKKTTSCDDMELEKLREREEAQTERAILPPIKEKDLQPQSRTITSLDLPDSEDYEVARHRRQSELKLKMPQQGARSGSTRRL